MTRKGPRETRVASDRMLIVLSGLSCTGKSTLADAMEAVHRACIVRARAVIHAHHGAQARGQLQTAGAELEAATGGAWLATAVEALGEVEGPVVVDSARTRKQLIALREVSLRTVHVGLSARLETRQMRFVARNEATDVGLTFEAMVERDGESENRALGDVADLVIDTSDRDADQTLGLLSRYLAACSSSF